MRLTHSCLRAFPILRTAVKLSSRPFFVESESDHRGNLEDASQAALIGP
jgi:hypothetical protein